MEATRHATAARRPRWRAALATLTLCFTSAVAVLVAAEPAHAICGGSSELTMTISVGGHYRGQVTANSGTCNWNGVYTGVLKDTRADGRGVFLELCDDSNGPCSEFYAGGNGNTTPVRRADSDGRMLFRLRWGGTTAPSWSEGF